MAGGMDLGGGGKGGKKPLDAAINLVPFIDLMAVTISFLIMSAVWTQVGRLQVASSGPSDPSQEEQEQIDPITLRLADENGGPSLHLTVGQADWGAIPAPRDPLTKKTDMSALAAKLKEARAQVPKQQTIIVETTDAVRYEDLVKVIDECRGPELFTNVSVAPAGG